MCIQALENQRLLDPKVHLTHREENTHLADGISEDPFHGVIQNAHDGPTNIVIAPIQMKDSQNSAGR